MRWPLRRQILLPMVGILLLTIGVVSALNAWLATAGLQRQLQAQLASVAQTFSRTNIPLTASVLQQTRGLTGAEFVATDLRGQPVAASDYQLVPAASGGSQRAGQLDLASSIEVGSRRFIHAVLPLDRRAAGGGEFLLHVFYPEAQWREARWQALWPPLAIGGAAVLLVAVAAFLVAAHVTQPIERLRSQVAAIGQGRFDPVPLPKRDDEIRELAAAVNQMARQLDQYEDGLRQGERLRTLGTLGGGIAHQIRNAATGCRIALDLHQRDCPLGEANGHADEPLSVAIRQLGLIETHIQRFLTLGRPPAAQKREVDLAVLVEQAIDLVRPSAAHLGVALEFASPAERLVLHADCESLVQMVVNLLVNGIEATAQARLDAHRVESSGKAVRIRLHQNGSLCELAVIDSGPGPAPLIQPRLFEPFATDKPGGTGLGLAVVRQIAEDHGGSVRWERRGAQTWFLVELPHSSHLAPRDEIPHAEREDYCGRST